MAELKPCPFCGGKPELYKCDSLGSCCISDKYAMRFMIGQSLLYWFLICNRCKVKTKPYKSKAKLISAWNRRADNG